MVSGMNRRIKEVAVRTETDLRAVDRREKAPSKVRNIKRKRVTLRSFFNGGLLSRNASNEVQRCVTTQILAALGTYF